MDLKEWFALAAIILNFINLTSTFYDKWLQRRRARQPLEQPQYRMGRIKSFFAKPLTSYLISTISILTMLVALGIEFYTAGPVTVGRVFSISFFTAFVLFQIFFIFMRYLVSKIDDTHQKIFLFS
jgi:hypothetical protein